MSYEEEGAPRAALEDHVERHLGPIESVLHELVSPVVHVDVYLVAPSDEHPFRTLVTGGLSDLPMTGQPPGAEDLRRAELVAALPPGWPLDEDALADPRTGWPIELLKTLARFPHVEQTWLWGGHTLAMAEPPEPFAPNTTLCACLLVAPVHLPEGFAVLERPGADDVHFFELLPLHADELRLARQRDVGALYEAFDRANVDVVIDPQRPSAVRRRGFLRRR